MKKNYTTNVLYHDSAFEKSLQAKGCRKKQWMQEIIIPLRLKYGVWNHSPLTTDDASLDKIGLN